MSFSWTLLWKFHFFFNWPLEFPRSSIPLEIPCLLHPCHLFGLDFFWNSPVLLVCIHIVLGSHLKQVLTVLFSLSRAGSYIFKTANIGMLTFLLVFQAGWCRELFFFLSLSHCFITATYRRFSTGLAQARKQYGRTKTRFSFKIKDRIILFELEGILKNNLSLFKLDSKTLLVHHCTITSTKWQNMKVTPTLILLEDISIKIIRRGLLYS